MFHPETVTKPMTKNELRKLNFDATECLYLLLWRLFGDPKVQTDLADEYARFVKENNRISRHLSDIMLRDTKRRDKWFWPVRWDSNTTKEERMLALTKCIKAFHYEMKRYEAVLAKHFDKVLKYCEENKIDLNQYKNPPYWRNWKEKD